MQTKPQRLQLSRKRGAKLPPGTVVVSRPGILGNPFKADDPAKAVQAFREYLDGKTGLTCGPRSGIALGFIPDWDRRERMLKMIERIRGLNVACWCPLNKPCHGDVILELANK